MELKTIYEIRLCCFKLSYYSKPNGTNYSDCSSPFVQKTAPFLF